VKRLATALPMVLLLASCAVYKAQHGGTDVNTSRGEEAAQQLPADPQTVSSFEAQPLGLKQAVLISELDKYREELKANGKYDCCVKPVCHQCAMTRGECHCRRDIDTTSPCGECVQGWMEGRGNTMEVDLDRLLEELGCARNFYEPKKGQGKGAASQPAAKSRPEAQ
jgi:hypothetical protein